MISAATTRLEQITPRLPVTNVEEALRFYCEQMGFQLGWKWGDPLTHANVCRDSISLDLVLLPPRSGAAMAYVQVSGVDSYHAELKSGNIDITAVEDRPYGMRDFEVVDPWGNRLAFGEPVAG